MSKENGGVEITEIRWLSRVDEGKRYGSIVVWLADKVAADNFLQQGLVEVRGESCIVDEWEIQSAAHKRCFKCQAFGHQAARCARPTLCGNCAEEGHSHKECINEISLSVSLRWCDTKHFHFMK